MYHYDDTLHGKRDFADGIKFKDLEMEDYSGLSRWLGLIMWVLKSRGQREKEMGQRDERC